MLSNKRGRTRRRELKECSCRAAHATCLDSAQTRVMAQGKYRCLVVSRCRQTRTVGKPRCSFSTLLVVRRRAIICFNQNSAMLMSRER